MKELESVFEQDYTRNGLAWRLPKEEMVWVDLDMTGFQANGKMYEGATPGYITGKREERRGTRHRSHMPTDTERS